MIPIDVWINDAYLSYEATPPASYINNQGKRTGTIDDAIANFNDYLPKRR